MKCEWFEDQRDLGEAHFKKNQIVRKLNAWGCLSLKAGRCGAFQSRALGMALEPYFMCLLGTEESDEDQRCLTLLFDFGLCSRNSVTRKIH